MLWICRTATAAGQGLTFLRDHPHSKSAELQMGHLQDRQKNGSETEMIAALA